MASSRLSSTKQRMRTSQDQMTDKPRAPYLAGDATAFLQLAQPQSHVEMRSRPVERPVFIDAKRPALSWTAPHFSTNVPINRPFSTISSSETRGSAPRYPLRLSPYLANTELRGGLPEEDIGGALSSLFGMTFSPHRAITSFQSSGSPSILPCDPSALRQITVGVPRSPMASDAAMFTRSRLSASVPAGP